MLISYYRFFVLEKNIGLPTELNHQQEDIDLVQLAHFSTDPVTQLI